MLKFKQEIHKKGEVFACEDVQAHRVLPGVQHDAGCNSAVSARKESGLVILRLGFGAIRTMHQWTFGKNL